MLADAYQKWVDDKADYLVSKDEKETVPTHSYPVGNPEMIVQIKGREGHFGLGITCDNG